MNPMLNAAAVAAQVGVSAPSVYRILSEFQRKGWIYRKNRNERWEICFDILRKQVWPLLSKLHVGTALRRR